MVHGSIPHFWGSVWGPNRAHIVCIL